jgi:hypothetical protein
MRDVINGRMHFPLISQIKEAELAELSARPALHLNLRDQRDLH